MGFHWLHILLSPYIIIFLSSWLALQMSTEDLLIPLKASILLLKSCTEVLHRRLPYSCWRLPYSSWSLMVSVSSWGKKESDKTCYGWYPVSIAYSQYPVYQDILISISSYPHIPISSYIYIPISSYSHIPISSYLYIPISSYPHIPISSYPLILISSYPSYLHILISLYPHILLSSNPLIPHIFISSYPSYLHILISLYPHILLSSNPLIPHIFISSYLYITISSLWYLFFPGLPLISSYLPHSGYIWLNGWCIDLLFTALNEWGYLWKNRGVLMVNGFPREVRGSKSTDRFQWCLLM